MPISALLVRVPPAPHEDPDSLRAYASYLQQLEGQLRSDPRLELSPPIGCAWPVVADTQDPEETDALIEGLQELPGVTGVDVVMVDFSDAVEEIL